MSYNGKRIILIGLFLVAVNLLFSVSPAVAGWLSGWGKRVKITIDHNDMVAAPYEYYNTGDDDSAPSGEWWNSNYQYRKKLTITAPAGEAIPVSYTAILEFDHAALVSAGKSLSSGNDLRVAYWNGSAWVELDRYSVGTADNETGTNWNSATTKIAFKIQAQIAAGASDNNYYLYYGYSAAGSPPANQANVNAYWRNFDAETSGNMAANWVQTPGTPANTCEARVSNAVTPPSTPNSILGRTLATPINHPTGYFTDSYISAANVEVFARVRRISTTGSARFGLLARFQSVTGGWKGYNFEYRNDTTCRIAITGYWDTTDETALVTSGTLTNDGTTNFNYLKLQCLGTTIRGKRWLSGESEPGTWTLSTTDSTLTAGGYIGLKIRYGDANVYGDVVYFDNLRARIIISGTASYQLDSEVAYFYGEYWSALTFTPSTAHKITSVKLKLYRSGSPGTITVSIRATDAGHPTGADLCSGSTDGNTLTTSSAGEWRDITLGAGYDLASGTKYAIVVRALSGNSTNYIRWRLDSTSPTYAGGCLEASSNSGSTWTSYTTADYMFEEWGVGDLSTFPVLVHLSTSSGRNGDDVSFVFDELQSDANRKKIAVTTSDGTTQCYVEIEKWDDANEKAWLWVKVPSVSGTVDTDLYLYYDITQADNTTYVGDSGSRPEVWDTNFKGVWHLKDLTTSTVEDSTLNNNDGTKKAANQPIEVDAKIGKGQDFTPTTEYIQVGTTGFSASSGTVELWGKAEAFSGVEANYLFGHTVTPGFSQRIQLYTDDAGGNLDLGLGNSHTRHTNIQDLAEGVWYYIVLTWDGTNYVVYVDSVSKATGTYTGLTSIQSLADIGNAGETATGRIEAWNGVIDEVRVSNVPRSAAWIKASYESERDDLIDFEGETTPILSVSISTDTYDFGTFYGSTITVSSANITVVNDGNVTETYSIKCSSSSHWAVNNTPGNDEFTLQVAFHSSQPSNDDISWKTDDILTESLQQCTTSAFSIDGSEHGKDVPPFASNIRNLWFRLKTPLSTSTTTEQSITVTISAEQSP